MELIYFIILAAVSGAGLYFGSKQKRLVVCAVATATSFILAFNAGSIEIHTGKAIFVVREVGVILACWALAAVSLAITLIGVMSYAGSRNKSGQAVQPGGAF